MRKLFAMGAAIAGALAVTASPAGAQQLVDASGERGGGGLAFVLMTLMVLVIGAVMFAMDRIRRRASDDDATSTP